MLLPAPHLQLPHAQACHILPPSVLHVLVSEPHCLLASFRFTVTTPESDGRHEWIVPNVSRYHTVCVQLPFVNAQHMYMYGTFKLQSRRSHGNRTSTSKLHDSAALSKLHEQPQQLCYWKVACLRANSNPCTPEQSNLQLVLQIQKALSV